MNIMQIIWGLDIGGAEKMVVELSLQLKARGHNVSICTITKKGDLSSHAIKMGIPVYLINKKSRFDISALFKIVLLLRRKQIDIVNTHLITADLWGRLAAFIANIPVIIVTEHSVNPVYYRSRFQILLDTLFSRFTTKIIAVSEKVKEYHLNAQTYPSEIFKVIYNGVDEYIFNNSNNSQLLKKEIGIKNLSAPVIGYIGRLAQQKRPDHFIQILREVSRKHPDVIGLIVGDGCMRKELERDVKELCLTDNVIFIGTRNDIPELLQAMDLLLVTSEQEGFSVVILEAMASGIPVVATDVGGNAEAIDHNKNGFVHSFGDLSSLSNSVVRLINDQDMRTRFGIAGKNILNQKFSITETVSETESLYEELFSKTKNGTKTSNHPS